jgi:hypothetical protein
MAKHYDCVLPFIFKTMKKYILLFSVAFLVSCKQEQTFQKEIIGNWKSASAESMNGSYGIREFSFTENKWEVKLTLYSDEQTKNPIFTFRGYGNYKYQNQSKTIENCANYVLGFDKKFVTLKTPDSLIAKNFGLSTLILNQETDVTKNGISFIESKTVCDKEFDIVTMKSDTLFGGKRPKKGKSLCEEINRPTSLGMPLIRVK